MSYKQMTGNIISATKVEPNGANTNSAASGVWNLQDAYDYTRGANWPNAANVPQVGLFFGGYTSAYTNTIQQINIVTAGNATDFGDLTTNSYNDASAAVSSSTRGVIAIGHDELNSQGASNIIEYVTMASAGNSTDFGDLLKKTRDLGGASNSTRGIWGGGRTGGSPAEGYINVIQYITIANTGNSTDFGNLSVVKKYPVALSSPTRTVFSGGMLNDGSQTNVMEYVTIGSTGDVTDFGDLSAAKRMAAAAASNTRGLIAGGYSNAYINVIEYITIANTGNTTDFGDLTLNRGNGFGPCAGLSRAVFGGGYGGSGAASNVIDFVTIASTGNASDFGDLLAAAYGVSGCSDSHGGIAA